MRGNDSVASVEECVLRRKRNRDLDRGCLSDRQNLHTYLERKAESAVRGESAAQKRPSEAEADMESQKLGTEKIRSGPVRNASRTRTSKIGTTPSESIG